MFKLLRLTQNLTPCHFISIPGIRESLYNEAEGEPAAQQRQSSPFSGIKIVNTLSRRSKRKERSWSNWPSPKLATTHLLIVYSSYFPTLPDCTRFAGACGEQNNKRRLAYLQSPSCTQAQENKAFCGCFEHGWLHYRHDTARHCAGKEGLKLKSDPDKGSKAPVAKSRQNCGRCIGLNARAVRAGAFSLWSCK